MAHVASNNNDHTNLSSSPPFLDRLTHDVIKETSKNLRYYIDVKRRENGFILNPNSSSANAVPLKARFIHGTTKEYPPLYSSSYTDNDVKNHFRSLKQPPQQPYRQSYSTSRSPEKQMCRKELHYHMRASKYSPSGSQKFSELRLAPPIRASSSCSRLSGSDSRRRISKSPRNERDQLVDDAADILATMVKTRRTIYQTTMFSHQMPAVYDSRNTNPSPRPIDEQSNAYSNASAPNRRTSDLRLLQTIEQPQKQSRKTDNILDRAAAIMYNAKPTTNRILCDYKVSVTTGNCNGASSNAPMRIKFFGTDGYSDFSFLTGSQTHRVPFLKDQTDVFTLQTDHVGQLVGITIGHDRKEIQANWFLSHVSIEDPIRHTAHEIPCNAWLSSASNDEKTMRDFQVASMRQLEDNTASHVRQKEIDRRSSSSSSTTTTDHSGSASSTSGIPKHQASGHQQRRSSSSSTTDQLAEPAPATTVESHLNPKEVSQPVAARRQVRSPVIFSRASSEAESDRTTTLHQKSSITSDQETAENHDQSTNGLHRHPSDDPPRPPARLEKRTPPASQSPAPPMKGKEETNDSEAFSFFD